MARVVAFVQARTGSTRLPGKIFADLAGRDMLEHVMRRATAAREVEEVWVATTDRPGDDTVVERCRQAGWPCARGSEHDVLARFYHAAERAAADVVVRLTSDCPLLDPEVIDAVVEALHGADYATNTLPPRTFPRGLDVEAFSFAALERAFREDNDPRTREHVTPYLYRNPDRFALRAVTHSEVLGDLRWTVDTEEDLNLLRRMLEGIAPDDFSWHSALALYRAHPEWHAINQAIGQKEVPG
ncbi:MAG: glycosyltransferase family protein [Myxococcota bacterium]